MSEASDCDSYTKSLANIGWKGNVFLETQNRWAIIFLQENILKYEWNDNVHIQVSVNITLAEQKNNLNDLILYHRRQNTHNVSGKISPKIRMTSTQHRNKQNVIRLFKQKCSDITNITSNAFLNISMMLTKQKKNKHLLVCRG